MKSLKNLSLIVLSVILFTACADAQTRKTAANKKVQNKTTKNVPKPPVEKSNEQTPAEYKVLIEGQYSKVDVPFLVVARDAETFALLRTLVNDLPASSTVDFTKTAVVAAFAGQRNKGGWTVAIRPVPNKTVIDLREPRKDEMHTQALAYPFQIVLVPAGQMQPLLIEATPTWTNRMKIYRLTKAEFESSGGIAGRARKFLAAGTVGTINFGDLVTYHFDLTGTGGDEGKKLSEMASGVVKSGTVQLTNLNAGTFGDFPHPPLKVFGTVTDNKLALTFESHPPTIADGFMLRGSLEAVKSN